MKIKTYVKFIDISYQGHFACYQSIIRLTATYFSRLSHNLTSHSHVFGQPCQANGTRHGYITYLKYFDK